MFMGWGACPPTGFAFGEGGIARPSLGVRAPPPDLPPGMAGRRRGTGEFIMGTEPGVDRAGEGMFGGACRKRVSTADHHDHPEDASRGQAYLLGRVHCLRM